MTSVLFAFSILVMIWLIRETYLRSISKSSILEFILYVFAGVVLQILSTFPVIYFAPDIKWVTPCIVVFGVLVSVQIFSYLIYFCYRLLVLVDEEVSKKNMIMIMAGLLITPNVVFGLLYLHWALFFIGEVNRHPLDLIYFSFAINYSLPLTEGVYTTLLTKINNTPGLQIIQVFHIVTAKIMELAVLGFVVSIFIGSIQKRKSQDSTTSGGNENE